MSETEETGTDEQRVSDELEQWLRGEGEKTVGGLFDVFEERAFAIVFVLLLGVPALPVPTGGATHVFEVIAVLLALQLVLGRDEPWLPQRFRKRQLEHDGRFIRSLLKTMRFLERFSKPRFTFLFGNRLSNAVYGLLVIAGSVAAFFAPPFTGLDTLPALGVVILSLGVLLEDAVLAAIGIGIGAAGVIVEITLGKAAVDQIKDLF